MDFAQNNHLHAKEINFKKPLETTHNSVPIDESVLNFVAKNDLATKNIFSSKPTAIKSLT